MFFFRPNGRVDAVSMMTLSDASSLMDGGEAIDGAAHSGMYFLNFLFIYWLFMQNNIFGKYFFYFTLS